MAFTMNDFSKIWASTSPLTPYEFSDSNYQQGWNFIGATPPARQMWDFLQKRNDEKAQWLYNNKLSLSGGTMTGDIVFSGSNQIHNSVDNEMIRINGGTDDNHGARFVASGMSRSGNSAGQFECVASDGTNTVKLKGTPDGGLFWNDLTFGLPNGTYNISFYSFGYLTASATSLDLSFPYVAKDKDIRFNSLTATLRSYKGYLSPGGAGGSDILTGSTQGTWYKKDSACPCMFRLVRSDGWGTNGENNTIVVGELTANVTVTGE